MDAYVNEIVEGGAIYLERPLLTMRERRKILNRISQTKRILEQASFYDLLSDHALYVRRIMIAKRSGKEPDERDVSKALSIRTRLAPFRSEYGALEYLNDRIEADIRERKRLALLKKLKQGMGTEAVTVADNLSDALSRMGFKDEQYNPRNGKTRVRRVKFSHCDIRPDRMFFKIDNIRKMFWFGYKNVLPNGVKLSNLLDDKIMLDLSLAVQRPVTFEVTKNNGAWLVYHRIRKEDEIPTLVSYSDVMKLYPAESRKKLMIPAGVREGKRLVWVSMAEYPHALVAGTTGGGKSNAGHVMLCSLIDRHTPAEVKLLMVDLKGGLDLSQYAGIPHLVGKIVSEVPQVNDLLKAIDREMTKRFQTLLNSNCKNIDVYNARYDEQIAHVFVFIDEFQQVLTGQHKAANMELLLKILAQGRAPGIHLIITTQTPKTDILPTLAQSNIGMKLVGRMETLGASMTALQSGDATKLPKIPGRMLLQVGETIELQTPYISDFEQSEIISRAKSRRVTVTKTDQPRIQQPTPATAVTTAPKVTDQARSVLELVNSGKGRVIDIAESLSISKQQAHQTLTGLRANGLVAQDGKGKPYVITGEGMKVIGADTTSASM
jgi:hypothetical protein